MEIGCQKSCIVKSDFSDVFALFFVDQQLKISEYKSYILSTYDTVQEYNSLPGQDVLLVDRYTELLITQRHRCGRKSASRQRRFVS